MRASLLLVAASTFLRRHSLRLTGSSRLRFLWFLVHRMVCCVDDFNCYSDLDCHEDEYSRIYARQPSPARKLKSWGSQKEFLCRSRWPARLTDGAPPARRIQVKLPSFARSPRFYHALAASPPDAMVSCKNLEYLGYSSIGTLLPLWPTMQPSIICSFHGNK